MALPGLLYLLINNYIPMYGIIIAFKKVDYSKGVYGGDWVGLDNFKYLFSTKDAWIITRNTLAYNFVFIVVGLFVGFIVGLALFEVFSKTLQKVYQTTILLPQLISIIIVSYIVFGFLSNDTGMINKLLGDNAINFYSEPKYWPFILTFVHIWKGLGYNAIIFLSSICGIDANLYDAAKVDGANKFQQIMNVTLPQLKPTIITLFLLQCGRIFYSDFGLFYTVPLAAGALNDVTATLDVYTYKALMIKNSIATASAASTYQAIVGFILVMTVNGIVKKVDRDNALF
ncbi:MAG: ABC transporter permease subunit [Oscillospiraceae bacterium]|nr:ABC transporter permease subunit [Oscillospiraceae bacterium]